MAQKPHYWTQDEDNIILESVKAYPKSLKEAFTQAAELIGVNTLCVYNRYYRELKQGHKPRKKTPIVTEQQVEIPEVQEVQSTPIIKQELDSKTVKGNLNFVINNITKVNEVLASRYLDNALQGLKNIQTLLGI